MLLQWPLRTPEGHLSKSVPDSSAVRDVRYEGGCGVNIALFRYVEGWNQLRFGIDGAKCPDFQTADRRRCERAFLSCQRIPRVRRFQAGAIEIPHLGVHQGCAALADLHSQPHNRFGVNACDALD
jgi:hypothetical protein